MSAMIGKTQQKNWQNFSESVLGVQIPMIFI